MSRIKKRAYISSAIIILMLLGLALYAQQQSQELTVEFDKLQQPYFASETKNEIAPEANSDTPETIATPTEGTSASPNPPPAPKTSPKLKNIFIDINEFQATVPSITVNAGYEVHLYIKSLTPIGADGLNVTVPGQKTTLVKSGVTEEFIFTATADLAIAISKEDTPSKTLYTIDVNVK